MPYWERMQALQARLRDAYAAVLGAPARDVALTTSTSEGIMRVVAGLDLGAGDEVLTSDEEHPGLLGPLLAARDRSGMNIRTAPLHELPGEVGPTTKLVACSHVGWLRGDLAPPFDGIPDDVPVLLDGAQGAGAIPLALPEMRCDFYAAAGQKWLCGPVGTGMLYVAPAWPERLHPVGPGFLSYVDAHGPPEEWELHPGARRHDTPILPGELCAAAVAAADLLSAFGWPTVHARAAELAATLAEQLTERGRDVGDRARTTLVAFEDADPEAALERLSKAGVALRDLPGTSYLRASVGAWNDESDLERLLDAL